MARLSLPLKGTTVACARLMGTKKRYQETRLNGAESRNGMLNCTSLAGLNTLFPETTTQTRYFLQEYTNSAKYDTLKNLAAIFDFISLCQLNSESNHMMWSINT